MIKKLGFCMLLLACAAAFEMYDDNRPFGMDQSGDEMYNEENYDYQDLGPYRPELQDPAQSLMLYQLFNSLQNRDEDRLRMRYRPKFSMMESPISGYSHVPYSELMEFKGAVAKRHGSAPGSVPTSATTSGQHIQSENPKQVEQKGKNIRKLPYWVCFLKLCYIRRPPVTTA